MSRTTLRGGEWASRFLPLGDILTQRRQVDGPKSTSRRWHDVQLVRLTFRKGSGRLAAREPGSVIRTTRVWDVGFESFSGFPVIIFAEQNPLTLTFDKTGTVTGRG